MSTWAQPGRLRRTGRCLGLKKIKPQPIHLSQAVACSDQRSRLSGKDLFDNRPKHKTDPPTRWFIAETDYGVKLKVCFIYHPDTQLVEIKSAFKPNEDEIAIYNKYG